MDDILDTRFEGKDVELKDHRVKPGDDVNLSGLEPGLKNLHVGVGWDVVSFDADALDVDVSVFLLGRDDKTRMDEDFVFYNNLKDFSGAVKHGGDSRTGAGDGDDESVHIDLQGVSFDVFKLVFVVSIYRGDEKQQCVGQIQNGYIRLANADSNHELCRYMFPAEIEEHRETAMIVGSLNREGPKWHFTPLQEYVEGGLGPIAVRYGCQVVQS